MHTVENSCIYLNNIPHLPVGQDWVGSQFSPIPIRARLEVFGWTCPLTQRNCLRQRQRS